MQPERDIDRVSLGKQSAGQMRRPALERPEVGLPLLDRLSPKDAPVEGVPRDQGPLCRQLGGRGGALVEDVKHPSPGGNHSAHAGHVVVVPGPAGAANPLIVAGRTHHVVMSHGVTAGIMQVVGPFIDVFRPGLDLFDPLAVLADDCRAVRG